MDTNVEAQYVCDLSALDAVQRARRGHLASEILPEILEKRELTMGYEFRFEYSPSLFNGLAELAALEHLCCPFFEIALKLEKNSNRLWLQITGDPGVKQFVQAEMNL